MITKYKTCDELRAGVEEKYKQLVKNMIGIDVDRLSLKCSNIVVRDCLKCGKPLEVKDCGLQEDNIVLYWDFLQGKVQTNNYCAGIESGNDANNHVFCYDLSASDAVESMVKTSDKIRTAAYAAERVEKQMQQRLNHNKEVTDQYIESILKGRYVHQVKERQKMWREIENEIKIQAQKTTLFTLGHYHLLTVWYKFGTIVVLPGTLLDSLKFPRKHGFLSNVGHAILLSMSPLRILIRRVQEGITLTRHFTSRASPKGDPSPCNASS